MKLVKLQNLVIIPILKIRILAVECYLSCIIALKNSQVRSDLRMLVEITFSTVGKLHVKLFTHLGFKF
jgi:hypothetical protein